MKNEKTNLHRSKNVSAKIEGFSKEADSEETNSVGIIESQEEEVVLGHILVGGSTSSKSTRKCHEKRRDPYAYIWVQ